MNEHEQAAILTLSLMAAFADGRQDDAERAELKRIAEALGGGGSIKVASLYQDVLLKRVSMASAVAALTTRETRQLAFEMAVCVCDADGSPSTGEQAFLADLQSALALDSEQAQAYTHQAAAIAGLADEAPNAAAAANPPAAPAAYASTLTESELDRKILNAAILNGALELLPESLSTMAIIPLQMKLVYAIGQSYGFELDRGHVKDFLATLGVGLSSQYLEQAGRKLLGGLLGKLGGGLLGGFGKQAVSSGMSFASTYALGHVARRYYAGGRVLSAAMLRATFDGILAEAKGVQTRYLPEMQARARTLDTAQIVELVRRA